MLLVVGGNSRNIGKTSLVVSLLGVLRGDWIAVKITLHGHGICSKSGDPCGCALEPECPYAIDEEQDSAGRSDTSRFLAAGAKRSLWVRAPMDSLAAAMPALKTALAGQANVIIESNSVLEFLDPDLYLAVVDPAVADWKDSARRFLDRADAVVVVGAGPAPAAKRVFNVRPGHYVSPQLAAFVMKRVEASC